MAISGSAGEEVGPREFHASRNVLSNWAGFIVNALITFLLSPFIVAQIGETAYGTWMLVMSLTGYLGLLDLGVRGAVTRYVAKFHAQGDHAEASRTACSALAIFTAGGLLALAAAAALSGILPRVFDLPSDYRAAAQIVLVLAGADVALSLVSGVFGGIVVGLQRFDLSNGVEIMSTTARALAIVAALNSESGLVALATIQVGATLARGVAYLVISRHLYPGLRIRPHGSDRSHVKLILTFSVYMFLLHVSSVIVFHSDAVVIAAFLPVASVTSYAIASNLLYYTGAMLSGISTVIPPLVSGLEVRGGHHDVRETLVLAARVATMIMTPILATFIFRGSSFIDLWMGPAFGELSGHVLMVLSFAMLFAAGNRVAAATMVGIGRHRGLVPIFVGEAAVNLALSVALAPRWGVVGVAWGTTLPYVATSCLFWPWYLRSTLGLPVLQWAGAVWVRPGVACVPYALATVATEHWWPARGLFVLLIQAALALPLALLGYWFVCLSSRERESLVRRVSPLTRRPWRIAR